MIFVQMKMRRRYRLLIGKYLFAIYIVNTLKTYIAVIGKARKITPTTTNVAVRIKEQINVTHELLPLLLFGDGGGDIFSVII